MTVISYMGADLVAEQLDWSMTAGWDEGECAANAFYSPSPTFPSRFEAFVGRVVDAGFDTLDVWTGQLNWKWATPSHLDAAAQILSERGVRVASYAGLFGETIDELTAAAGVARALGTRILGGNTGLLTTDRSAALGVLESTGRVLAIENHPDDFTPGDVLRKIGSDGRGILGTAVDTGWWATNGYDAASAIRELGPHIQHVHLKDIVATGAHETCALGEGIVDIVGCLRAIEEVGYVGPLSIEHEPESFDPTSDLILSRSRLLEWLA